MFIAAGICIMRDWVSFMSSFPRQTPLHMFSLWFFFFRFWGYVERFSNSLTSHGGFWLLAVDRLQKLMT